MRWYDEILGTKWKHRILKPLTFIGPTVAALVHDRMYETNFFILSAIAGFLCMSTMMHHNIGATKKN